MNESANVLFLSCRWKPNRIGGVLSLGPGRSGACTQRAAATCTPSFLGVLGLLEAKDSVTSQKTPEGSKHLVSLLPLLSTLQGQIAQFPWDKNLGLQVGELTRKSGWSCK